MLDDKARYHCLVSDRPVLSATPGKQHHLPAWKRKNYSYPFGIFYARTCKITKRAENSQDSQDPQDPLDAGCKLRYSCKQNVNKRNEIGICRRRRIWSKIYRSTYRIDAAGAGYQARPERTTRAVLFFVAMHGWVRILTGWILCETKVPLYLRTRIVLLK